MLVTAMLLTTTAASAVGAIVLPRPRPDFHRTIDIPRACTWRGAELELEARGRVVRHRPEPWHWHTGPPFT